MAKKRKRSSGKGEQRRIDGSAIHDVSTWFERMLTHAHRALDLASRTSVDDCNESNDLFWALAKYAENVQESITQLDKINNKILLRLVEIPITSDNAGYTAWADLKGMRIKLAHKFWEIDPKVLWQTVTDDFPKLILLLSTITVIPTPVQESETVKFMVPTNRLSSLPPATVDIQPEPGRSLLCLWFDSNGDPQVFRVSPGHRRDQLVMVSSDAITVEGVYGIRYHDGPGVE